MEPVSLRAYQQRLVDIAIAYNTVVILPTGAGKTLIAGELMRCKGGLSVFLVPACVLVKQQAIALRSWTKLSVEEHMGGMQFPSAFDILVTTPKAFESAQIRGTAPPWSHFTSVVFDEVHHALKEHPYRKLALSLRNSSASPRILGLTASVTYAVEMGKINAAMRRLCEDLQIEKMETASSDELRACGYHALGTQADVKTADQDLPGMVTEGTVPVTDRKPHEMAKTFFRRVQQGTATQFALELVACIRSMEAAICSVHPSFMSPLECTSLKEWGVWASKKVHTSHLEHWYEALRLLVISWEEAADASIAFLQMTNSLVAGTEADRWRSLPFPRFDNLKEVLEHQLLERGNAFRGIVFVQQKLMTHVLDFVIRSDAELSTVLSPVCLYATSSPASPSFRLTKSDEQERLGKFAEGRANLLITTAVAEEGLDITRANCVIRFDPVQHAVSFVQGRGRAREVDSSFIILSEQEGRSAEQLAVAEQRQLAVAQSFEPTVRGPAEVEKERVAQRTRERGARHVLEAAQLEEGKGVLSALNLYCKKTKVNVLEALFKEGGNWVCTMSYKSCLRDINGRGSAAGKKEAKLQASVQLMYHLRAVDH